MWSGRQLQLLNGSLHFSVLELASPIARGRGEFISSHIWNPEWRHLSLSQAPFRGHVKAPTKNTFCPFHGERFFCLAPATFPRLRTSPEEELAIFSSQTHCPFACQNARLVVPFSQRLPGLPLLIWRGQCSQTPLLVGEILQQVLRTICLDIYTRILDRCPCLTGWIFVRSYIKINVLIMAEEAEI